MQTLTSRERVRRAVAHEPADRYPIDLGMHFSTGISVFAYYNLRKYLGLSTDNIELIDCVQMLARVDDDIIGRFHVDTVCLNPPYDNRYKFTFHDKYEMLVPGSYKPVKTDNGYMVRQGEHRMYMPKGAHFFDGDWLNFYDWPEDVSLAKFAQRAERLRKETDKYTMLMGFTAYFYDLDFACDMLTDPEKCIEQNQRTFDWSVRYFDTVNAMFGQYIDCIEVNGDLGTQHGLMCTPESFERVSYPFLKKFCEHVHRNSDIKIFIHSCGSVYDALPYIADAGVDILNPVQISAAKMDPARLKREFGGKLCFWGGGCNTQQVLGVGTPEQVRENVKMLTDIFKPGGGFVFNQVHNIMGNVPPENIVAMLDTAYENSFYGE